MDSVRENGYWMYWKQFVNFDKLAGLISNNFINVKEQITTKGNGKINGYAK